MDKDIRMIADKLDLSGNRGAWITKLFWVSQLFVLPGFALAIFPSDLAKVFGGTVMILGIIIDLWGVLSARFIFREEWEIDDEDDEEDEEE